MSDYIAHLPGKTTLSDLDYSAYYPHLYADVPTLRLLTYNTRSYSCKAISGKYRRRRTRLKRNLNDVFRYADVACIQETKTTTPDFYHSFSADMYVFQNPYYVHGDPIIITDTEEDSGSDGADSDSDVYVHGLDGSDSDEEGKIHVSKAGTDIFVRKSFARNFKLVHTVHKVGYIQSVTFVPLSSISTDHPCFKTTFTVVNVYIPNDSVESALGALSCLRDLKFEVDPGYIFAGGDWNIIARPYDTTGKESPGVLVDALNEATAAHNLTEIVSPAKTRISGETPPKLSRLDRWYISHSEAEKTLIEPRIWLPPHTYEPGQGNGAPSDHFPVLLDFAGISSSS